MKKLINILNEIKIIDLVKQFKFDFPIKKKNFVKLLSFDFDYENDLFHYTEEKNLKSIKENGLQPEDGFVYFANNPFYYLDSGGKLLLYTNRKLIKKLVNNKFYRDSKEDRSAIYDIINDLSRFLRLDKNLRGDAKYNKRNKESDKIERIIKNNIKYKNVLVKQAIPFKYLKIIKL